MQSVPDQYTNLTWLDDDGLWRAWTFSESTNRYYFDDLGEESFTDTWEYLWAASEGDITTHCLECGTEVGYEDDCPNGCDEAEEQESLWEGTLTEL